MKLKNFLLTATAIVALGGFSACKKDNNASSEIETTFELSGDQAISDNLNSDAEYVLNEAGIDNNFSGNSPVTATSTLNVLSCATVTVTPLQGFPKNITIDFGGGCTSTNGITRSGKLYITLSDSLRKSGSIAVMTFENYYVSGFKKEGKITWTNTSQGSVKSWQRKCEDGKVTAPGGRYWLHTGMQEVAQTQGSSTPYNLLDDVFSITGSHTVTNDAGKSRTSEITEALEKKVSCENIDMGKIKIEGPNHFAVLDFGDGSCDKIATISIDGNTPRTILLR
ncbi:MAG TPA: hypothetical protein VGP55_11230 [Chitinophagaceae bacterium]|nr:hypothetical protein [Chitinophagaceae bacterium]